MTDHGQIIETIRGMSVLELSDLAKTTEEGFGVTAAAPTVIADTVGGASAAVEKTEFNVELTLAGSSKIKVVRTVREATDLGLKDAKELVNGAPKVIREVLPKEEAERPKEQLEEVGATVELKQFKYLKLDNQGFIASIAIV